MQLTVCGPIQSGKLQKGASLLEVLIAILVLSFGMLALAGMISYAVQLPKLSGYRSAATSLAAGHVDRMRANAAGYVAGAYVTANPTYNRSLAGPPACSYPTCSTGSIASLDTYFTAVNIRNSLPGGTKDAAVGAGLHITCTGSCANREGSLWIIWDEPTSVAALANSNSDECPPGLIAADSTRPPRCLLVRFKL